tara:strand:+ start:86 stop:316 length:231 start_codon:yes stop_codon:yes gene_type:complete
MRRKGRRKLKDELNAYEILKLYSREFSKSPGRGYRIPFRFNKDNPRESNLFCVHGRFYGRGVSILGTQQDNVRKTF